MTARHQRLVSTLMGDLQRLRACLGAIGDSLDPNNPARWASRTLNTNLDDWRAEIMETESHRICVIAARQSGKSTITAARAAYTAARYPGHRIVLVSPTFRQSTAFRSKVLNCLLRAGVEHDQTREDIRLRNGSTIRALPGDDPDKVRGATAQSPIVAITANVMADELAAYMKDGMNEVLTKPLLPSDLEAVIRAYAEKGEAGQDAPVVDPLHFEETRGTLGEETYHRLVGKFIAEGEDLVAQLAHGDARDGAEIANRCHKVTGSAAIFGATEMQTTLKAIEAALKSGDIDRTAARLSEVERVWKETRSALSA
jgi:HPt (histidine-containing phosphotransfer) domain-containing protein